MAYFNDKANVKTGVNARSNFNLSQHVITTQDISRLQIIFKREMIPGDKFIVKPNSFHRLAPLPCPTYGNIKNVTRAFFVPCRILMNGFEHVITQTNLQTQSGPVSPTIPYFTNDSVVSAFTQQSQGLVESFTGGDDNTCDFKINTTYFRFTYRGKVIFNLLISLGYRINWTTSDTTKMSLLPLLAYGRLYLDWYMPTQYEPSDPLNSYFTSPNLAITTGSQFANLISVFRYFEMLEKDFYTSAWPSPSGPVGLKTITLSNASFGLDNSNNPLFIDNNSYPAIEGNTDAIYNLSQYGLNTLKAVQDFVNRDMIAGNRYIEQMFARYGVQVPDSWLRRAEYLGSHSEPVQISDVMATAGTQDAQVGDYAGKGISYSNSDFTYEAKEFGYFIVINCLIAETGYWQGRDRENLHLDPFDFFTPEFDQLGAAPIRNDELFVGYKDEPSYQAGRSYGGKPDGVFGFAEQYYEYKNSRDYLLGDFAIPSRNSNADSYHLFRTFPAPSTANPLALNLSFMAGDPTSKSNNFNRIFQDMGSYNDHFISEHFVEVSASRPMHGRADSLVTEGGRELEMSFNGYQL